MPTIKDIAKAAGVSHATVSNVLNKKGNVSSQKIKLVQEVAHSIGYRLNEAASSLRSGRGRALAVILPDVKSAAYADFYAGLSQTAQRYEYSVLLHTTDNIPAVEKRAIDEVASSRADCALLVSSLSNPHQRCEALVNGGTRILLAERAAASDPDFMGFDMEAAAQALAQQAARDGMHSIGLMSNMTLYPNEKQFVHTFTRTFADLVPQGQVQCVQSIATQYAKQAFSFFCSNGSPDAIITTCEEMADAVLAVWPLYEQEKQPKIYTLATARLLGNPRYTRYELDYRLLGSTMAEQLLCDAPHAARFLPAKGIVQTMRSPAKSITETINMLSIANPYTKALIKLLPFFAREKGIEVQITTLPTAEVTQALSRPGDTDVFDVVRMDLALLDCYAKELFLPLDQLPLDLARIESSLLDGLMEEYGLVDQVPYALPFDSSQHLLFYRQDLFEDVSNQRSFFEENHVALTIPTDYSQFLRVASFFDRRFHPKSKTPHGTLIARQSSEIIAHLVALSADGSLPLDDKQAMLTMLEQRRELETVASILDTSRWDVAVERFAQGECAMLIVYANYAEMLASNPLSHVSGRVGFAPAPGKHTLLGGGVLGVSKVTEKKEAVAAFLQWLYSDETSRLLALLGGISPCKPVYENQEILDVYPWLRTLENGHITGVRRRIFATCPRPFNQLSLEHSIAFACQNAIHGVMSCEQALHSIEKLYHSTIQS
ncbi:MAG: extracellular solute-binding protein [Clostridia bacterium]